jgi:short-subunit dehydrogenase
LAGTNVRVSVVVPGPVKTRFHERMGAQNDNYIRFMGLMSVEQVAQSAYVNFMRGRKVIVPGAVNMVSALFLRILPHTLLVPFAAWLLRRREGVGDA